MTEGQFAVIFAILITIAYNPDNGWHTTVTFFSALGGILLVELLIFLWRKPR
jgi:hypothetical protein